MCEIDITSLFEADTWPLSGSIATHGANAGPSTWANANAEAAERPLLTTSVELEAMRRWAKATGAWDKEEIAAWSDTELNALFIQLVAGDKREAGLDDIELDDDDAWADYEKGAEDGRYSGSLYRGDDKRVYYYLGG